MRKLRKQINHMRSNVYSYLTITSHLFIRNKVISCATRWQNEIKVFLQFIEIASIEALPQILKFHLIPPPIFLIYIHPFFTVSAHLTISLRKKDLGNERISKNFSAVSFHQMVGLILLQNIVNIILNISMKLYCFRMYGLKLCKLS